MRNLILISSLFLLSTGCSFFPEVLHEPQYHNPFPQFSRVAILPFYNQSSEPTLDQDEVAKSYYIELQQIPGFEVMPVGVAKKKLGEYLTSHASGNASFQELAEYMKVDVLVVGAITDYSPYYPQRMGLAVNWYAANPAFHPIPPGYGLPWGTADEEFIPESLVFEAEFALAKEQLATQTPRSPNGQNRPGREQSLPLPQGPAALPIPGQVQGVSGLAAPEQFAGTEMIAAGRPGSQQPDLPRAWPNPRGFVPRAPSEKPPSYRPQNKPVMTHTKLYHGHDRDFTERLSKYFSFRDDERFGGWQSYLQRSEDFVAFCCHLHITEMLVARGGGGKTRVVLRSPGDRYEP